MTYLIWDKRNRDVVEGIGAQLERIFAMNISFATDSSDAELTDAINEKEHYASMFKLSPSAHIKCVTCDDLLEMSEFEDLREKLNPSLDTFVFVLISKELKKACDKYNGRSLLDSGEDKSVVYFLLDRKHNCVKVGYTKDIQKRLQPYETHNPAELELIKTIQGTKSTEKHICKQLRGVKVKGEWFRYTPYVKEFINNLG